MEAFDINVENRTELGSSVARKLKREGMVPGVLYQGGESLPIEMREDEIRHVLAGKMDYDLILNISFNNRQFKAKVKEVQREAISGEIRHVDLMPLETNGYIH
ncbi:50S ribosomal protein L25 [Acetivibrio cellulolyticus]|uniref:50S ribosomal protein L25 n=1 Tax=Acetivibrio cellulolyticus TaxID=35830 RepID=UPI0001E2FB9F|nr:50S ribosomal protein L25 [Acetivibrio cellulolyticus]